MNKRDFLLFIVVVLVAVLAAWVLLFVVPTAPPLSAKPVACFSYGGSSSGACR